MSILLVTADLATTSRVSGAATAGKVALRTAQAAPSGEAEPGEAYELAILDLSMPGLRVADTVAQLRALPAPPREIIAFGPHVQEALLQAAHDAGCDRVLARGQFFGQLDEIVAGAARRE